MAKEMYPIKISENDSGTIEIAQDDVSVYITKDQIGLLVEWLQEFENLPEEKCLDGENQCPMNSR